MSGDTSKMPESTKINFSEESHCQSTCVYTDSECEGGTRHAASLVETNFLEAEGGVQNLANIVLSQ